MSKSYVFTPQISLEDMGRLTKAYAILVVVFPDRHHDSLQGFEDWCVASGYAELREVAE